MAGSRGWVETPELGSLTVDKQTYLRAIDESYFRLRAERERMLKFYTTKSDEIKAIDGQIAGLRRQKTESLINISNLDLSLLQTRKASLERELDNSKKKIEDINLKTVSLRQLERERDLTEQNYQIYKKKAEDLRISDDLDSRRISDVKIAMPAIPPLTASYPKKNLIVLISALVGLLLGFGFSAVNEFFNHTFRGNEDIVDVLGVPLLLSMPLLIGPELQPVSQGVKRGLENLRRAFGRDNQMQPAPQPQRGSFMPGGMNMLIFFVMLGVGMGSYMLYEHKNPVVLSESILTAQAGSRSASPYGQVALASVYPAALLGEDRPKQAAPSAAVGGDEMHVHADDLEQRRATLEKERAEIDAELQRVRGQMEVQLRGAQPQGADINGGTPRPGSGNTGPYSEVRK